MTNVQIPMVIFPIGHSGFCPFGAPGEDRTPDLLVRSQPLYPTELRALPPSFVPRGVNGGTRTLNPWSHSPVL